MLFTEPAFFGLLIITLLIYYLVTTATAQIIVLVSASFIFYAWYNPALLFLLLASIALNALFSFMILDNPTKTRKGYFFLAIILNLSILAYFKYAGFIVSNSTWLFSAAAISFVAAVPLPIGISFYTFEGISLTTDVYRGTYRPARNWKYFPLHLRNTSLFIAFFPHLIAGPILKANQFMPQIGSKCISEIDFDRAVKALLLGYFLKSVIADNLAEHTGFMNYYAYTSSLNLIFMLVSYSCQILADFAGYSSIAIGIALLFGYKLPANFNWPYISQSFSEFWRRWHISLSTWLRDYLYFPLGGNRLGIMRTQINLLTVMVLGGLWHGAAWKFAAWGLWHGSALVFERPFHGSWFYRTEHWVMRILRIILVFVVVSAGWLLFQMPTFGDAIGYLRAMTTNLHTVPNLNEIFVMALLCLPIVSLHFAKLFQERGGVIPGVVVNGAYGVMFFFLLTSPGPTHAFIYFQF